MKLLPNLQSIILICLFCFLTDNFDKTCSYTCEVNREKSSNDIWAWVLPYANPCECTEVVMGKVVRETPVRSFTPVESGCILMSSDINAIRNHYRINCAKTGTTKAPAIVNHGSSITSTTAPDATRTIESTRPTTVVKSSASKDTTTIIIGTTKDPAVVNHETSIALSTSALDATRTTQSPRPTMRVQSSQSIDDTPAITCTTDRWHHFNGSCYFFQHEIKIDFTEARTVCENMGSNLASIHSKEEEDFVIENLDHAREVSADAYWIGLTDELVEDTFVWTDGTAFDHVFWADGEPNNGALFPFSNEDCAGIFKDSLELQDRTCTDEYKYVCRKGAPTPGAPTPITGVCETGWQLSIGFCYFFQHEIKMGFQKAQTVCINMGANLVSIHSDDEKEFVKEHLDHDRKVSVDAYWIGLTDELVENQFVWTDGTANDYDFWASGEPNNNWGNEHCAGIMKDSLELHDKSCTDHNKYVCKKTQNGGQNG